MLRIAVVGSGIAGLSSAWLLSRRYEVTLLEADGRLGGHSNTIDVSSADGSAIPVDTGFIVYNEPNYPELTKMFAHLGVATEWSDMSFAVSIDGGRLEYSGGSLGGLFGQRRNALRPSFMRMLFDIQRFNRAGLRFLAEDGAASITLGSFLEQGRFGKELIWTYLLPMAGAIWSTSPAGMLEFPAQTFLRFFANHNLLTINGHRRWRTVTGGSRSYVEALTKTVTGRVMRNARVTRIERSSAAIVVTTNDHQQSTFDAVVLACHADASAGLLGDAWNAARAHLQDVRFVPNRVVLHSDPTLMPRRRQVWSSWNYLADRQGASDRPVSVSYWMNRLQNLPLSTPLFVTMNPLQEPAPDRVHRDLTYDHPVFDHRAIAAQRAIDELQGEAGVFFAGAWLRNGFHEDGLASAIRVAAHFSIQPPWHSPLRATRGDSTFAMPDRAAAHPL